MKIKITRKDGSAIIGKKKSLTFTIFIRPRTVKQGKRKEVLHQ